MKRFAIYTITALVLLSVLLSACGAGATKKIRVATDATFPPFETVDETSKQLTGFDIDLLNAVARNAGLEIEWVNIGFEPMLAGLAHCQYDAAIAAISITDERNKDLLFSDSYINTGQIVTVRKDQTDIKSKDDLSGKKIGAQLGTTSAIEVGKISGAVLITYDAYDPAFQDLANGRLDAVIADYPTTLGFVNKNSGKLMIVGPVFTGESYGIAVCKQNPDLLAKINAGLARAKADGTIAQLEKKWLASK